MPLTRQRCWNHSDREAAACCPTCGNFYCRECVTEHAGRMVCAVCLRAQLAAERARSNPLKGRTGEWLRGPGTTLAWVAQAVAGLALAWFFFDLVAHELISLPENFHEGKFWKQALLHEEDNDE